MKKIVFGLTALAVVALGAPQLGKVDAQVMRKVDPNEKVEGFVKGRVVCQTCYLKDQTNVGLAHEGVPEYDEGMPEMCGVICAQKGRPLALLARDGKLYTITGELRERGDVRNHNGNVIRQNEPYPLVSVHFNHTIQIIGKVTENNGQREIAGTRVEWNSDTKDWRVGSTVETKFSEGGKIYKDGKPIE